MHDGQRCRLAALIAVVSFVVCAAGAAAGPTTAKPIFTDSTLTAGTTPVRVVHITELRQTIDALRIRRSLTRMTWTDPTLVSGTTAVKAVHLIEMRTALAGVYAAIPLTPPTYTNPTPVVGTTLITAVDIAELRAAVNAVWDLGAPTITNILPWAGTTAGGTVVTIAGTNFVNATVTLGGVPATSVTTPYGGGTTITAVTGAHAAGLVNLVVTNIDGQSATSVNAFVYAAAPTVSAISPTDGPNTGGTLVTVTGTGFISGTNVRIGNAWADIKTVTSTRITAQTNANANGTVDVRVENPGGQYATLASAFTYRAPVRTFTTPYELGFGDSITAGVTCTAFRNGCYESTFIEGYPAKLQAVLISQFGSSVNGVAVAVDNFGRPGDCASIPCNGASISGAQRLNTPLGGSYQLVILLEGVNDINSGVTPSDTAAALRSMVQASKAAGKAVLLSTLLPDVDNGWGPDPALVQALNVEIASVAASESVPLVDLYSEFLAADPSLTTLLSVDGLHPTSAGYQFMANTIYSAVRANFYVNR